MYQVFTLRFSKCTQCYYIDWGLLVHSFAHFYVFYAADQLFDWGFTFLCLIQIWMLSISEGPLYSLYFLRPCIRPVEPHLSFSKFTGDKTYVDRPRAPVGYWRWHGGRQTGVWGQWEAQSDWRQSQCEVHLHLVWGYSAEALHRDRHAGDWAVKTLKRTSANLRVSGRLFDPAYCYKARLCEVPEGFPELHVQVLGNAFKLSASQLWIDDVFPWGEEGEGCHTWKRMYGFKYQPSLTFYLYEDIRNKKTHD